jgi:hypothetical protein
MMAIRMTLLFRALGYPLFGPGLSSDQI